MYDAQHTPTVIIARFDSACTEVALLYDALAWIARQDRTASSSRLAAEAEQMGDWIHQLRLRHQIESGYLSGHIARQPALARHRLRQKRRQHLPLSEWWSDGAEGGAAA